MRFVLASYVYTKDFNDPAAWLTRINFYTGILEELSKKDEVISIEQINYEGDHYNNGVNYRFKRFSKTALRFFPWALHRYIKGLGPDIVVIQGFHFPLQIIQLRLMLGPHIKIIVQNHAERPFIGIKKYMQLTAGYFVNAYFFASRAMGIEWVTAGNLPSARKVYEVMEVSSVFYSVDRRMARSYTGAIGEQVFLWVGRLNQNKDPLTVVRAFLQYAAAVAGARLYMIYHTSELMPEIQALLKAEQTAAGTITMVGKVPHADLLNWFNSADFIISGSHYEGGGTAVCEAMSCGCVPVVTDISSFRMITDNGNCGVLYEAGNEQALLKALQQTRQMNMQVKQHLTLAWFGEKLSFKAIAAQFHQIASSL